MPDYGHRLQFGTFVTPSNAVPTRPVELAILSETLGFDLVTFQDHPYQAAFHDTWTLLAWVAARTERIRVSANVLNLPLRPPAVLARAAASLDLLSGGRLELGLGAGGFADAIAGMGGSRLTPGQAVDAIAEAIPIIRGIWAADDRAPLTLDGEHHRVDGAQRGPLPAHDIPIWLGARKPRMLRLVGRAADGWLPSLPWLGDGGLARGNAVIDQAAVDAGRDPREIRRLLNVGGPSGSLTDWAEQLTGMALEDGVSTFVIMGDDPRHLQAFAEEVAPAVRDAVTRERADRTSTIGASTAGAIRSAAALEARRSGIDYDGVPASLADRAVEPGDAGFSRVRSTYLRGGDPGLVLRPSTPEEVTDALLFARRQPVPLAIRSGGHGISGRSTNDGGVVIDVGALDEITVLDAATRRVRLGPGARWMEVARVLGERGWALSSGDYGGVGVGGLATAGGIGWLARSRGLTIDHLRAVEIVLADGSHVRADETANADLLWAVRGAGANFGIVTAFEFEVDIVGKVGWAQLALDASDTAGFLERWGAAVEASPRDLTSFLMIGRPHPGRPTVAHVMAMVESDDPETILDRLRPLAETGALLDQSVQLLDYADVMSNAQGGHHAGQGEPNSRSALLPHLDAVVAADAAELLDSGDVHFLSLRSVGGAVSDVPEDATAYAHRSANFSLAAFGADRDRMDAHWDRLRKHFSGIYLSFESDDRPGRIADAFPPATLARLRELKAKYDPDTVFRDNFNVAPVGIG